MTDILNTLILILLLLDCFLLLVFELKKLSLLKKQKDLLREVKKGKGVWARVVYDGEEEDER